jgi:hypothetical protein
MYPRDFRVTNVHKGAYTRGTNMASVTILKSENLFKCTRKYVTNLKRFWILFLAEIIVCHIHSSLSVPNLHQIKTNI